MTPKPDNAEDLARALTHYSETAAERATKQEATEDLHDTLVNAILALTFLTMLAAIVPALMLLWKAALR